MSVSTQPNSYLFLDVDGVMLPFTSNQNDAFSDQCCEALFKIVESTGAIIVLSTSWRCVSESKILAEEQLKRKVGLSQSQYLVTPTLQEFSFQDPAITRVKEIALFFDQLGEKFPFIAIDDMDLSLETITAYNKKNASAAEEISNLKLFMKEKFVLTNASFGLTDKDARKAISLIEKQKQQFQSLKTISTTAGITNKNKKK